MSTTLWSQATEAQELQIHKESTPGACTRVCVNRFSHIRLFQNPWTVAHKSLSLGFSRQESWSGLPRPPPGDLPDRRIEPTSPAASALQTDSLPLSHGVGPTWGQINGNKWVIRRQVGALRQRGHLQPFQSVIILKYEEEGHREEGKPSGGMGGVSA